MEILINNAQMMLSTPKQLSIWDFMMKLWFLQK